MLWRSHGEIIMPSSIILLLIQMAKNICWKNMWILLIAYRVYIGFRRLLSSYCLSWKMIKWDCVITFQKLIFCHPKLSIVCNGKILTTKELGFIISSPVILKYSIISSICFAFCSYKIILVNALAHLQKRKPHDIQPTKFDIYLKMQTCLNIQIHWLSHFCLKLQILEVRLY